jgi:hypothetical protein
LESPGAFVELLRGGRSGDEVDILGRFVVVWVWPFGLVVAVVSPAVVAVAAGVVVLPFPFPFVVPVVCWLPCASAVAENRDKAAAADRRSDRFKESRDDPMATTLPLSTSCAKGRDLRCMVLAMQTHKSCWTVNGDCSCVHLGDREWLGRIGGSNAGPK